MRGSGIETVADPQRAGGPRRFPVTWAFGARPDLVIALSWIPVWLAARVALGGGSATAAHRLHTWVALALLMSFLHQPLTFGIVYGDARQLAERRRFFLLAPVAAATVVGVAVSGSPALFSIMVTVGALWNLVHILQQRYGLSRIYARKSGYGSARADRALLYVSMLAGLIAVAASPGLVDLIRRARLDAFTSGALNLITTVHSVALILLGPVLAALAGCLWLSVRHEALAGPAANPARWLYLVSMLTLIGSIVVDPAAGFVAYIASHAIEYAVVVWCTAERRYGPARPTDRGGLLGRVGRTATGRFLFFAGIVVLAYAVYHLATGRVGLTIIYTVGALHFLYDALIWKLRRPAVASAFAVPTPPAPA